MRPKGEMESSEHLPGIEQRETGQRLEIEVKIINLRQEDCDPAQLQKRIEALGGALEIPRRLLEDVSFKIPKDHTQGAATLTVACQDFANADDLRRVVALLGLHEKESEEGAITAEKLDELPKRSVRVRRDGENVILSIKESCTKGAAVDNRVEEEVVVTRPEAVQEMLSTCGYAPESPRQKFRTSFVLDNAHVELNEGPKAPPWIEVEAETEEKVLEIVQRLEYADSDIATLSDSEYYMQHGVPFEESRSLTFDAS